MLVINVFVNIYVYNDTFLLCAILLLDHVL